MTSKEALEQIAKSKGIDPLTNEIKTIATLFNSYFELLDILGKKENTLQNEIS